MEHQTLHDTLYGHRQPEQSHAATYYVDSGNPFAKPVELLPYWEDGEQQEDAIGDVTIVDPDEHGAELLAAIRRSAANDETFLIGIAERAQVRLATDARGIAYVAMNKSGYVELDSGQNGFVATAGLAGCIGAAGFGSRADGSTAQFTSHYGQYAQSASVTGKDSPINEHMSNFDAQDVQPTSDAEHRPAQYVVAYHAMAHNDPDYGLRQGDFKDWHYLDQIQATAEGLRPQSSTLFLPYHGSINTLAAGRDAFGEGIYWNGMRIDFEDAEGIAAIPGAALVRGSSH